MLRVRTTAFILALGLSVPVGGQQADPAALFEQGVSWQQFLADVRSQRERWQTNAGRASPPADLVERLRKAGDGLRFLVIAEGACSDSVSTVPYLAKLAERAGIELRIVGRDTGRPIMEQHRTPDDRPATPTVVLLRSARKAAVWVERPAALQQWYLTAGQALGQQERLSRKMSWYDWDRGDQTMTEIVALAEEDRGPDDGHRTEEARQDREEGTAALQGPSPQR